jgi:hypothetical protein
MAETADISAAVRALSLPFAKASGPSSAAVAKPVTSRPRVGTGTEDISQFVPREATPFLKTGTPTAPPLGGATPPREPIKPPSAPPPAAATAPRELTLEQYASLSAELSISPERVGAILAKYGVPGVDGRRALDRAWEARFSTNPELQQRWQALQAQYRRWLLERR